MHPTDAKGTPLPFSYDLPVDRIAQRPIHPADAAKLMCIERSTGELTHRHFYDLPGLLRPNDHLVFNDTRVIPARLFGRLEGPEGAGIEILLVREIGSYRWLCIGRPLKRIRSAARLYFNPHLSAHIVDSTSPDRVIIEFQGAGDRPLGDLIREHGIMPIPPYIRDGLADDQDRTDYQTIFAEKEGSVAAPTASLHFTPELMSRIASDVGCSVSRITLHVGTASFLPILVNGELRPPESERFSVPSTVLDSLIETRQRGGRVIAVGTTVVRALESAARSAASDDFGDTELFIQPGYKFSLVSSLITNFHQPGTTHLLLVEAILGGDLLKKSYQAAIEDDYRFLSYGDGMVIL